jgi:hypothetical protein
VLTGDRFDLRDLGIDCLKLPSQLIASGMQVTELATSAFDLLHQIRCAESCDGAGATSTLGFLPGIAGVAGVAGHQGSWVNVRIRQ